MRSHIYNIFWSLCVFVTVSLQVYCLIRFYRNEDISTISYKKFHQNINAIYPSFSFCVIPPVLQDELNICQKQAKQQNKTEDFCLEDLSYEYWDDRVSEKGYDNITVSLEDNLIATHLLLHDYTSFVVSNFTLGQTSTGFTPSYYVSFRAITRKCFTFDIPLMKRSLVFRLGILIKKSLFPKGHRPSNYGFYTYIHYPGQRLTTYNTVKYEWPKRENKTSNYFMKFNIKDVDVISYRNKHNDPCYEDWKGHDSLIMDGLVKESGCKPIYWNTSQQIRTCSGIAEMKNFRGQPTTSKVQSYPSPCRAIERLHSNYHEKDVDEGSYETMGLGNLR